MKQYIKINGITDVTMLVKNAIATQGDVNIVKGKYCVDAKSIMGVFSLDLSTGATIEYPDEAKEFDEYISKFKA